MVLVENQAQKELNVYLNINNKSMNATPLQSYLS